MSKTKILEELFNLTKTECQGIGDDWLGNEELLTIHEKLLLEVRLAAHANDPDAGSTWEEVEDRIQARLTCEPNGSNTDLILAPDANADVTEYRDPWPY